jgi:hypothetical protein
MKQSIVATGAFLVIFLSSSFMSAESSLESTQSCLTSFFTDSLHYAGEGMRRWYEEEGGFIEITKIPYDQLDCKSCHVKLKAAIRVI